MQNHRPSRGRCPAAPQPALPAANVTRPAEPANTRGTPKPVATPNLHQKTQRAGEKRVGHLTIAASPSSHSFPGILSARRRWGHPQERRREGREITTYGFIYQSAAAGHTAMRSTWRGPASLHNLPAPRRTRRPPSRPADAWGAGRWAPASCDWAL